MIYKVTTIICFTSEKDERGLFSSHDRTPFYRNILYKIFFASRKRERFLPFKRKTKKDVVVLTITFSVIRVIFNYRMKGMFLV